MVNTLLIKKELFLCLICKLYLGSRKWLQTSLQMLQIPHSRVPPIPSLSCEIAQPARNRKEDTKQHPEFHPTSFKYLMGCAMSRDRMNHLIIFWPETFPALGMAWGIPCFLSWLEGPPAGLEGTFHFISLVLLGQLVSAPVQVSVRRADSGHLLHLLLGVLLNRTNQNLANRQQCAFVNAVLHAQNTGWDSAPQCRCWQSTCPDVTVVISQVRYQLGWKTREAEIS